MNLVRSILFAIEAGESGNAPNPLQVEGFSAEQIGYHIYIMIEAGLIEGADVTHFGSKSPEAIASRLTWAGHEFLDAARDESRWKQVVSFAKEKAGSVSIAVLQQLLVLKMKSSLGL